jgi:UPF0716 family protein affecting phage T7 exclusion
MLYLVALVLPPLAILLAGRPVQAVLNGLLWILALILLILPFIPGMVTWAVCVVWAVLVVRERNQDSRDRRLVEQAVALDRSRRGF